MTSSNTRTTSAPTIAALDHHAKKYFGRNVKVRLTQLLTLIVILVAWEYILTPAMDPFFVSSPARIGSKLVTWVYDGTILPNFLYTMESTFIGYFVGCGLGVIFGFLMGRIPFFGDVAEPYLDALNSLPRVALAPLFTLWLGIDLAPKIVMVASLVFFIVVSNTRAGVRDVNQEYINVLKIMGADERTVLRKVVLPSAATWIFASLQVALPWALIGAVVGEMIASTKGMGHLILQSGGMMDSTGIFAGLLILMGAGLALTQLIRVVQARTERWRPQNVRN
jgi:NitT/TauT family transport system permease protein